MGKAPRPIWHETKKALILAVALLSSAGRGTAQYSPSGTATGSAANQPSSMASDINSQQNPFLGSVPSGKATPQVLPLSLREAIKRGLRYNLGLLLDEQSTQESKGQRWVALSRLLPQLTAETREAKEMVNLKAIGFPPGIRNVNPISGPFDVFDARAYLNSPILDFHALRNERAASEQVRAAEYSYQDARNLVVLAVANAYLLSVAAASRVREAEAQVHTAQALDDLARDRLHAGLSAADALSQAYARIYHALIVQSVSLAYIDAYYVFSVAAAILFLLSFFLKKNQPHPPGGPTE